jgi:hypothetical protein
MNQSADPALMPMQQNAGMVIPIPRLLTVADIMRLLQIGERQAYALSHAAGVVKLGRSLRVRPEDLDAYLERLAVDGAA